MRTGTICIAVALAYGCDATSPSTKTLAKLSDPCELSQLTGSILLARVVSPSAAKLTYSATLEPLDAGTNRPSTRAVFNVTYAGGAITCKPSSIAQGASTPAELHVAVTLDVVTDDGLFHQTMPAELVGHYDNGVGALGGVSVTKALGRASDNKGTYQASLEYLAWTNLYYVNGALTTSGSVEEESESGMTLEVGHLDP